MADRRRVAVLAAATLTWLAGFAILRGYGTWAQFAVAGPALAGLALAVDPATRALVRPGPRAIAAGLVAGALMVALTHLAFAAIAPHREDVRDGTVRLYELLHVGGFAAPVRAALIVVVASSEEVLFRGAILDRSPARIALLAAVYALAMVSLGSGLLVVAAFACGLVWGALRVATGSLVAPVLAHVLWDLGILVAWPLVRVS